MNEKIQIVNGKSKFTNEGFFHFMTNIGGLIELREYDFDGDDLADKTLSRHVQDYLDLFDKLKEVEKKIYEILEDDKRTA